MTDERFAYHGAIDAVQQGDLDHIRVKDVQYGASWKKRGGAGAFMMLARKWDRLEEMLQKDWNYDVLTAITDQEAVSGMEGEDGSILAEVRDLRRYLLLIEAEMLYRLGGMFANLAAAPSGSAEKRIPEHYHVSELTTIRDVMLDAEGNEYLISKADTTSLTDTVEHPTSDDVFRVAMPSERDQHVYEKIGVGQFQLAEPVDDKMYHTLTKPVQDMYRYLTVDRGNGETQEIWVINRDLLRPEYREALGYLANELNTYEHNMLPFWKKRLYTWVGAENKWRVLEFLRAGWTRP